MKEKIAILGAGNGGFAFSGHLGLKGFEVSLYEDPNFEKNIEEIKRKGVIEIIGAIEGFGPVAQVSTDIELVLKGAKVVMIVVPAFAQMVIFEAALPYLEDDQIVVFWPDNFGTILAKKIMDERKISKRIKLVGTASLLYSTRKIGLNQVRIAYEKADMPISSLPSIDTMNIIKELKDIIPQLSLAQNPIQVGLMNVNLVLHCATSVLNAGWIEHTKGNFEFYWEGMTESVCRVMEKIDEERRNVGKYLDLEMNSTLQILNKYYPTEEANTLHKFVTHSHAHGGVGPSAPTNLNHRYVTEDVPIGLVFTSSLGKLLGVPTPTINSIIQLASTLNDENYRKNGYSLERLGLDGMTKEQIISYVNYGKY